MDSETVAQHLLRDQLHDDLGLVLDHADARATCDCGTTSVVLWDQVRAGLVDVLLYCQLCRVGVVIGTAKRAGAA